MQPTDSASDEATLQVRRSYRVRTTNNPGWAVTGDPAVKAAQREQRALEAEQKKAAAAAKKAAKAEELAKRTEAADTLKEIEQSMLANQSKKKANASHTVNGNGCCGCSGHPSHGAKSAQAQAQATTTTQAGNPSQSIASGTEPVATTAIAPLVGPATGIGGNPVPVSVPVTGDQASGSRSLQPACPEASGSKFFFKLYVLLVAEC